MDAAAVGARGAGDADAAQGEVVLIAELHTVWDDVGAVRVRGRVNPPALAREQSTPHVVMVHGLGMATDYLEPTMRALGERVAVSALDLPGLGGSRRRAAGESRSLDPALRAPLGMTDSASGAVIPSERSAQPVIPSERSESRNLHPVIPSERSESRNLHLVIPSERSESRNPHRRAASLEQLAWALTEWLRVRGIASPVLVGQSYGCQVVVEAVTRAPAIASAIVLNAPTMLAERRSVVGQLLLVARDTPREPLSLLPHVVGDYLRAGPVRILATLRDALRDRIEEKLPAAPVPVSIVTGERDPVSPPAWCERLARLAGSRSGTPARFVLVPGAAHALPFTHPEALAAEILAAVHSLAAVRART
ncbi:MAG TPA: alpha/beta hydrolase [Gemmatimonadaceae bacterium]|nr:alpha/beta hydrolase [Gemmatimonadaceae bacterium]